MKTQPKVSYKPDNSPVTKADIEVEKLIRKIITKNFPDHGIIGKELPPVNPKAKYQWVIDPIDGTKQFIRRMPFWGIIIALLEKGTPIAAVTFLPIFNELATAEKNQSAYLNGKRTRVSKTKSLEHAYLVHASINRFQTLGKMQNFVDICESCEGKRGFGDVYGFNLLISGKVDILLDPGGFIQDFTAPALLVEEAGGKFTDFAGRFSLTSRSGLATNGILHNQVLKILNQ